MENNDASFLVDGSFGDKTVIVSEVRGGGENAPLVVLFHGVYGCANTRPGNKYGDLARVLAHRGANACVVETSRMRRDRDSFAHDSDAWVREAFEGKTFSMELNDVCTACNEIVERYPNSPIWLWGFSLGALMASTVLASYIPMWLENDGVISCELTAKGLVLAGASDTIREDERHRLSMPVIRTTVPQLYDEPMRHVIPSMNVSRIAAFYGTEDDTFTEEACRNYVSRSNLPNESKRFFVLDGVDHSFNIRNGKPDRSILTEMVDDISDWLFA